MRATICPNEFPSRTGVRRIAIVAEAPSSHEMAWTTCTSCKHQFASEYTDQRGTRQSWTRCASCGCVDIVSTPRPLVGPSGRLLNKLLDEAGIRREECFVGNVCQRQPPRNEISRFKWDGPEIQEGLEALRRDLTTFQPHFILALGGTALKALGRGSIDDRRGYLFMSDFLVESCTNCAGSGEVGGYPCQKCDGDEITGESVKTLATYHPARLLRESGLTGIARHDMGKAAVACRTDSIDVPERTIHHNFSRQTIVDLLAGIREKRIRVAIDIEGGVNGIACIGFATSPIYALVIPFTTADGESVWSEEDEITLMEAVRDILEDPLVPKIIQNALYELFVLAWATGIVIRGVRDDTMVKHFELYPEWEKSLEFQTSIYVPTQPWWKLTHRNVKGRYVPYRDGKPVTSQEWYIYNGTDCCVTYACDAAQERQLQPRQREHYRFNMELLTPLLYMMLKGIRYDYENAKTHRQAVQKRIYALQDRINREASSAPGRAELKRLLDALASGSLHDVLPLLTTAFCVARRVEKREVEETSWQPYRWNGKRWVKHGTRLGSPDLCLATYLLVGESDPNPPTTPTDCTRWLKSVVKLVTKNLPVEITSLKDVRRFARGAVKAQCRRSCAILTLSHRRGYLLPHQRGELATLLGLSVKIRASGRDRDEEDEETGDLIRGDERDANWFLYDHCALPKQYVKEGNRLTDRLASDDTAVCTAWSKTKDRRALWFLALKRLLTLKKFYEATTDEDGRMRFGLNLVGTPTGRMAAYGSPTGSSNINPQTIPKKARVLYKADEGCVLGQFDLDGSDSYSVAAYCAALGDRTMLEDNLARLKPAKILALIYERGERVNLLTRDELKGECKNVDGEGWLYFACKRILHGSNYAMGKYTMSNQILTDGYKLTGKPVWLDPATCQRIQERAFFVRYPGVRRWHRWMEDELKSTGELVACNGFKRRFYARKDDAETARAALSHMPQVLTTYSINLTLLRLWKDPENRRVDGSLRIEPLLCVHDSLIEQWRSEDTDFARVKLPEWFRNPVSVRGIDFTIPANGGAGPNWLHQGTEKWGKYGGIDL